jgi:DNA repair exonuclease SbcCD nuclease subunit
MAYHRILHISDFHFGSGDGVSLLEDKMYKNRLFEKLKELNENNAIDAVVISGDVVDKGEMKVYMKVQLLL